MTGYLNLHALLHVIFHCSVLNAYMKPRVNLIRMLPFGCAMLHYSSFFNCVLSLRPYLTHNTKPGNGSDNGEQDAPQPLTYTESTRLYVSPSGISELDCATTKTDTAERSISIGRESLEVFFVLRALAYFQVPPLGGSREEKWRSQ